jgi:hypothetical protein
MPLITTLGNNSVRGFNPGGTEKPVYIARVPSLADEVKNFPGNVNFMNGTWTHNGGTCDAGTINVSGTGTYKLYSLSMGKRLVAGSVPNILMRVYSGDITSTGNRVSSQSIIYPNLIDATSPYQCQELVFPEPVTLNRGTTYTVAYAVSSNLGSNSGALQAQTVRTTYNISAANGGGTLAFGSVPYFGDSDPFDQNNGTSFAGNGNGQIPVIGLIF